MTGQSAHFNVYRDRSRQWRWRLEAANGRIVADSAEGYTRRRDCDRAIAGMLKAAAQAVMAQQAAQP